MDKQLSSNGLSLLKDREEFRSKAYSDIGGVLTIGWGHTGDDVFPHMQITPSQGEILLHSDVSETEDTVNTYVKVPLTQNQFDALVIFTFNIGGGAFLNSTLLRLLNQGKYDEVPDQLLRWINVKGKKSEGLLNRRKAEINLWNSPSLENSL